MKTMLKVVFVTAFCAGISLAATDKPYVVTKQGKKIQYDKISSDAKGKLTLKSNKGISQVMKPGTYQFAWIPRPTAITSALKKLRGKKYADAAKAFDKCYSTYRHVGYDVDCIFYSAWALNKLGKKAEAIAKINKLTSRPKDPNKMKKYMEAKKLLADLYIDESKFGPAEGVLKELSGASDPAISAWANIKAGDILKKKGKRKDALLMYMRTALLYDKKNKKERPEALKKIIEILKEDKNNKYLEFEKISKTDYP